MELTKKSDVEYEGKIDDNKVKFFLNDKLLRSINIDQGVKTTEALMKGVKTEGPIIFLPDFTPANSLPIGTAFLINQNQRINPSWIGMDIGCGYSLIAADIKTKKVIKNGRLNSKKVTNIVDKINEVINSGRYKGHNGSLGQGNHFIDLFIVDKLLNHNKAKKAGLDPDKIYFLIHTGSREFGFKVNQKFSKIYKAEKDIQSFNYSYLTALNKAVKNAQNNRKIIAENIGRELGTDITHIFNNNHNCIDTLEIGGKTIYRVRKGATDLPKNDVTVIPGSCTSEAYLVAPGEGIDLTHGTVPHGTGRRYTREQAFSKLGKSSNLSKQFKGIQLNVPYKKMFEEAPQCYKSIKDIINAIQAAEITRPVARLIPLAVMVERK